MKLLIFLTVMNLHHKLLLWATLTEIWYLREWAGVDSQTGTPLWFKVDENGKKTVTGDYNEATRVLLDEVPTPKFNGAISTNLTWKGFTLNANFTFATGAMIL